MSQISLADLNVPDEMYDPSIICWLGRKNWLKTQKNWSFTRLGFQLETSIESGFYFKQFAAAPCNHHWPIVRPFCHFYEKYTFKNKS